MRAYRVTRPIGLAFVGLVWGPPIAGLVTATLSLPFVVRTGSDIVLVPVVEILGAVFGYGLGLLPAIVTIGFSIWRSRRASISFPVVSGIAAAMGAVLTLWLVGQPGSAPISTFFWPAPVGGAVAAWVIGRVALWAGLAQEVSPHSG